MSQEAPGAAPPTCRFEKSPSFDFFRQYLAIFRLLACGTHCHTSLNALRIFACDIVYVKVLNFEKIHPTSIERYPERKY